MIYEVIIRITYRAGGDIEYSIDEGSCWKEEARLAINNALEEMAENEIRPDFGDLRELNKIITDKILGLVDSYDHYGKFREGTKVTFEVNSQETISEMYREIGVITKIAKEYYLKYVWVSIWFVVFIIGWLISLISRHWDFISNLHILVPAWIMSW